MHRKYDDANAEIVCDALLLSHQTISPQQMAGCLSPWRVCLLLLLSNSPLREREKLSAIFMRVKCRSLSFRSIGSSLSMSETSKHHHQTPIFNAIRKCHATNHFSNNVQQNFSKRCFDMHFDYVLVRLCYGHLSLWEFVIKLLLVRTIIGTNLTTNSRCIATHNHCVSKSFGVNDIVWHQMKC